MANKRPWVHASVSGITFITAFLVYFLTTPLGLTWAHHGSDGGELITAVVTNGIPHPPGYPTYLLLGKLVAVLPWGNTAYRFNLFSAVCMGGTAAWVTAIALNQHKPAVLSVGYGLTFAWMPLVWSQAIITEVYALNLFVIAAALWSLISGRSAVLSGLLLGVSLTTHLTSVLLLPLALWMIPRRQWLAFTGAYAAGVTPFLLLFIFAHHPSPVLWGDARTISGWWWLVSGRLYQPNLFSASNQLIGARLWHWSAALGWQLGYVGWGFVAYALYKTIIKRALLPISTVTQKSAHLFMPLSGCMVLYALYAVGYDSVDAAVFFLPGLLLLSVGLILLPQLPSVAPVFWPLLLLTLNFQSLGHQNNDQPAAVAKTTLEQLPEQALVLTSGGGQTIFTLWYYQHVEGVRSDLVMVDTDLFAFDWYRQHLHQLHPSLKHVAQDDLKGFEQHNRPRRPFCYVNLNPLAISCVESNA